MHYHPVSGWLGAVGFALVMGGGAAAFAYAIRMRLGQVTQGGRPDVRTDAIGARIRNVLVYVLGQKRLPRNGYLYSGTLHMFIFGAFVVLSVDTSNFVIDGALRLIDVLAGNAMPQAPFALPFSEGPYQSLADTFRLLCIVGLGMAFVNRVVLKPARLPLTADAMKTLWFILGLMVFEVAQIGFEQAIRAAEGGTISSYTWFSGLFAGAVAGMDEATLKSGYRIAWWLHLVNLVGFVNYVPWSKHSHVFAAPLNIFFMSLEPRGAIRKMEIDVEAEDVEYFGARSLEDLSWKQLFDGLSCTECGRCTDNCPASKSGKPLKPMHIIVDLKHHMEARFAKRGETIDLEDDAAWLTPTLIDPDVLWSCTTCGACMEICPVGNEHVPDIIDMRRYLTMTMGEVGHGASKALQKMERAGNPWGMPKNDREGWIADAGVEVKKWSGPESAEYLYWVGCAGAYDDRAKKVTQAMARLMDKAGIDFAVLGNKERCTGDSARRLGDEYLFQSMAAENIALLDEQGVKKIITHCPHCFNTLKNEYPQLDGRYEVIHHVELLDRLVAEGKLKPAAHQAAERVVYHDSCYLGRYNEIYDPQRTLLAKMPGVDTVEAPLSRGRGLCCGAGGGQMWMELNIGDRMNYVRTDELIGTRPDTIAVACNFCMTMIDDGVKARSEEEAIRVVDLAEMLDERTREP